MVRWGWGGGSRTTINNITKNIDMQKASFLKYRQKYRQKILLPLRPKIRQPTTKGAKFYLRRCVCVALADYSVFFFCTSFFDDRHNVHGLGMFDTLKEEPWERPSRPGLTPPWSCSGSAGT